MTNRDKLIACTFFIFILIFTIFSYSQIDLNLTLSGNLYYQLIQKQLINLGYYQRQLSTIILGALLTISFIFYFWLLIKIKQHKIKSSLIKILIGVSLFLLFAYPAFSYDLFNYMFDARIVTKYHLSPYFFKALDFPNDPWIRFMHWTHRYYPYGLGWLIVSFVPSFLGFGKFVITLGLFKIMFGLFHIANCYLIKRISEKISPSTVIFNTAFYAFNPLILIESLISPHNEVMMLFFFLLSFYLLISSKIFCSLCWLLISISIKYISLVFLPLYYLIRNNTRRLLHWGFYIWLIFLVPVIISREIYAWYFIPIIGIAALIPDLLIVLIITIGINVGVLFKYLPFFYFGDYAPLTVNYQNIILLFGIIFGAIIATLIWRKRPHL